MTVDETIQHCEDIAKSLWCEGKEESAEEHLILAAWLRDYKRMQEPKTGHWIPIYQGDEVINYRCSECEFGNTFGKNTDGMYFCPRCGARMSEVSE